MPLKAASMAQILCLAREHSPATRHNRHFRIVPLLRITRLAWASAYRHLRERRSTKQPILCRLIQAGPRLSSDAPLSKTPCDTVVPASDCTRESFPTTLPTVNGSDTREDLPGEPRRFIMPIRILSMRSRRRCRGAVLH